jgi:hypothetical protein
MGGEKNILCCVCVVQKTKWLPLDLEKHFSFFGVTWLRLALLGWMTELGPIAFETFY